MYAVIFKAEINQLDTAYFETAARMRDLAITKYGCKEFVSCHEDGYEIAISYWSDKNQIQSWKNDPEHKQAQALGKSTWYRSYQVQVVEVLKQYGSNA